MAESSTGPRRDPVTRDRVLTTAMELADTGGVAALTMRSLAQALGVQPMSLYHHVANKDAILDGLVDAVFERIHLPEVGQDWQEQMRRRARSARAVLGAHPWALALMESRTSPGPMTLRHHDAVIGTLREGGLSLERTALAYAVLDAYVYGFVLQEASLPFASGPAPGPDAGDVAQEMLASFEAGYPHLAAFASAQVLAGDYDFGAQFDVGLELVLAGLAAP